MIIIMFIFSILIHESMNNLYSILYSDHVNFLTGKYAIVLLLILNVFPYL